MQRTTTPSATNAQSGEDGIHWPEQQWPTAKVVTVVTPQYKIIQANLQRKQLATNEVLMEATKRKVAVALLQEPYVGGIKCMKSYQGVRVFQNEERGEGTTKAAIAVLDPDLDIIQHPQLTTNNIVVVEAKTNAWKVTLISYYFEPNKPIEPYLKHIKRIESKLGPKGLILGGDANAKSSWWGGNVEDERGEIMSGTLEEMGLHILNSGNIHTFDCIRGGTRYKSFVDVTACSTDMLDLVEDWRVDEGLTSSDHNGITFRLLLQKSKGTQINRTTRIYNTKKANWVQFREKLTQLTQENHITTTHINNINTKIDLEELINRYTQIITDTCTNTIPNKKQNTTLTIPWWSEKLADMKKEVATRKRRIRNAAPVRREMVVRRYLEQKEKYELEVAKAQTASWKGFCEKQETEGVWEGIYRIINRTTKRQQDPPMVKSGQTLDKEESAKYIAETFYPKDLREAEGEHHTRIRKEAEEVNEGNHGDLWDPPFTADELNRAVYSFNPKKAPGPDGFTADICAHAVSCNPDVFLAALNKCLELNCFPRAWKVATVIVLRKPGKQDYRVPKSYRPIGLLPIFGKILEKMVVARLKYHILPKLSTRQYGFMPQKSTEDSLYVLMQRIRTKLAEKKMVTLVSLDIEGAFDSAWWPAMKVRLAEEKCPINLRRIIGSYLSEREVRVRYAGTEHRIKTEKGCVQGSIGGPFLWNLLLDPLLKELEQRGYWCQAFADDIILMFEGEAASEIQEHANAALDHVRRWGVMNKLKFAPHKTKAMLVTRKIKYDTPHLNMGGTDIAMTDELKILGLTIDKALTFNTHVANVCAKAIGIYKQLARAAKISWGLHPDIIRIIYTAAVEPIVLYAASAWAPTVNKLGARKKLNAMQRGFAQKLCRAYRTVSLNAALVLAGILPLDLRIREVASLYEVKRGEPHPALSGGEIERMASALEMPHPAEQEEVTITYLVDEEQYRNFSNYKMRIFTDGSKIEGKVGAAISVWCGEAEVKTRKLALSPHNTVYQAELLALREAVREILLRGETTNAIYSDSMAALLTTKNHGALHPLAVETRDALRCIKSQNKSVSLFWIKAHAGLEGNERADYLAKEAALKSKRRPDYDKYPISFAKRIIRKGTLDEWDRRYSEGETAAGTKLFFPSAVDAYRTIRCIDITMQLTQALTGHGGFSEYLHRFKCKGDPSCSCDPDEQETVTHLLTQCPQFGRIRHDIEQSTGVNMVAENLPRLINGKNSKQILAYITLIVTKTNEKNKT